MVSEAAAIAAARALLELVPFKDPSPLTATSSALAEAKRCPKPLLRRPSLACGSLGGVLNHQGGVQGPPLGGVETT